MKTFNVTHDEVISFDNLLEADRNASKNKRYRDENLKFAAHREEELINGIILSCRKIPDEENL